MVTDKAVAGSEAAGSEAAVAAAAVPGRLGGLSMAGAATVTTVGQ